MAILKVARMGHPVLRQNRRAILGVVEMERDRLHALASSESEADEHSLR